MRTSVLTFETRLRQRFHATAAQAHLHARPGDPEAIDRLVQAVQDGHVTLRDAHQALSELRRQQTTRPHTRAA